MRQHRVALLCGHDRPLLAAIARELTRADMRLFIQAAPAEAAAARRLCRAGHDVTVICAELGGDAASRRLLAAARGIDSVIICPAIAGDAHAREPGLDAWQAGLAAGLRVPFFLAKQVGLRFRRSGGQLVFAIDGVPRGAGAMPRVLRSTLLTMVEALTRALRPNVAVAAVVGAGQPAAAEIARGVRLLMADGSQASGTILELGEPLRRG